MGKHTEKDNDIIDKITRLVIVTDEGRTLDELGISNLRLITQDYRRTLKIIYPKGQEIPDSMRTMFMGYHRAFN